MYLGCIYYLGCVGVNERGGVCPRREGDVPFQGLFFVVGVCDRVRR